MVTRRLLVWRYALAWIRYGTVFSCVLRYRCRGLSLSSVGTAVKKLPFGHGFGWAFCRCFGFSFRIDRAEEPPPLSEHRTHGSTYYSQHRTLCVLAPLPTHHYLLTLASPLHPYVRELGAAPAVFLSHALPRTCSRFHRT